MQNVVRFVDRQEVAGRFVTVKAELVLRPSTDEGATFVSDATYQLMDLQLSSPDGITPDVIHGVQWRELVKKAPINPSVCTIDWEAETVTGHSNPEATLSEDEKVITSWLVANLLGDDPNRAVGNLLGITPNAAAQRVYRLREKGLLPKATPGQRRR